MEICKYYGILDWEHQQETIKESKEIIILWFFVKKKKKKKKKKLTIKSEQYNICSG